MIECMMMDADFCIKLGGSEKYPFLLDVLPSVAKKIFIHNDAFQEVRYPVCAVSQLTKLVSSTVVEIVDEASMNPFDKRVYQTAYQTLAAVMIDPRQPKKNKGEVSSLAWAKTRGIPVFATDECNLQPIIDAVLNAGIDDIRCLRIEDLVVMARDGDLVLQRRLAKVLWVVAGKNKENFDQQVWPLS